MKYLIIAIALMSLNASANEECKKVGELAFEIMIKRQVNDDVFVVLDLYKDNQDMVFDAFEQPKYSSFKYLSNAINASNSIVRADELRKKDEVDELQKQTINQFKLKHIKACLSK